MRVVLAVCLASTLLWCCDDSPTSSEGNDTGSIKRQFLGGWRRETGPVLSLSSEELWFGESSAVYTEIPELPCHEDPLAPHRCYDTLVLTFGAWWVAVDTLYLAEGVKAIDRDTVAYGLCDTIAFRLWADSLALRGGFGMLSDSVLFVRRKWDKCRTQRMLPTSSRTV
jgi:hypothetical protein